MARGSGAEQDLHAARPRGEQDLSYSEHPLHGDRQLEDALRADLGVEPGELRYRRVTIPLTELEHLRQTPEDFLLDGDELGYTSALAFAEDYQAGNDLPPITVSKPEWPPGDQWSVADGWHRLTGAFAAGQESINALEAYLPNRNPEAGRG